MDEFGGVFAINLNDAQMGQGGDAVQSGVFGAIGHVENPSWLMA